MGDDFSTAKTETEVPLLDGAWLRRERERIAIGRRQVASRLGLPDSQVIRVEMNKLPVPSEWFTALSELGFPVPAEVLAVNARADATTVDPINRPARTDVPPPVELASVGAEPEGSSAISPTVAAAGQLRIEDAPPSLPSPETAPESAAEPSVAISESAAPPSEPSSEPTLSPSFAPSAALVPAESPGLAEPPTAPSAGPNLSPSTAPSDTSGMAASPAVAAPPASPHRRSIAAAPRPTLLRGRWLRAQRQAREISPKRLCQALAIPETSLPHFERNDMPVPPGWLPKLAELGLLPAGSSDLVAGSTSTAARYTGRWLRRERKKRGLWHIAIAPALHISGASLEVIETRDWPLPLEWLPILRQLGLPASEADAALSAHTTPSTEAAPLPDAKPKALVQRAARAAHKSNSKPAGKSEGKPFTGAWLRQLRLKKKLTQLELSQKLHVNQTKIWRCETEQHPLPPDWLPVLHKLGFRGPTAPKAEPSTAVSPTAAVSAKPAPKKAARAAADQAIDGRWLKAERDRLGLSAAVLHRHLHVSSRTYGRFERPRVRVPQSWWPTLRELGLNLPAAPPAPPSKPTPHSGPLDGAWLARERKRLRLTEYEVCRVLKANARMLRRIEREAAELPKAWLAKLPLLGIAVEATSASQGQAHNANTTTPPAAPALASKPSKKTATAPTATASEPATASKPATAASEGADLAALIVHYRVSFGRRAKQPPIEILKRILADLSESGLDGTITDEDVERAAQVLIRRR